MPLFLFLQNKSATHSSMVGITLWHWETGHALMFNPFLCSLSPQKKSQQEDSEEEEEEENAPQWQGSSETWRIAASVNSPIYNIFCMKWLLTLSPVSSFFHFFFYISACSLSRSSVNGTRGLWNSFYVMKLTNHFNVSLRIHFLLSWSLSQTLPSAFLLTVMARVRGGRPL